MSRGGGRGINASLAVQAERLKTSMQSRDKRRSREAQQRQERLRDDPYERAAAAATDSGPSSLGAAMEATAAVAHAAALAGPQGYTCDLCKVTFYSVAEMRQHNDGPTHRKAVAKDQAMRERNARLGAQASAAAEAVAAASWAEGGRAPQARSYVPQHTQAPAAAAHKGPRPPQAAAPQAVGRPRASHTDLVASARKLAAPISINGWMPPGLATPAPGPTIQSRPDPVPARPPSSLLAQQSPAADSPTSDSSRDTQSYGKGEGAEVKQEHTNQEPGLEGIKPEPESLQAGVGASASIKQDPGADVKSEPEQAGQGSADGTGGAGALAGLGSYASDSEGSHGAAPDTELPLGFF